MTKEQTAKYLTERFEKKDMDSRLDQKQFQAAVREFYPRFQMQHADQTVYGISFEIGDVVQSVYYENFETYLYFNTEEAYLENVNDCDEEEKSYYRFEAWAEWDVMSAESDLFRQLQAYLEQNSLYFCTMCSDQDCSAEAFAWYKELELEFENAFDEECYLIRKWMAEALGELRKEGFFAEQGNADLLVIPFGGEDEISMEELMETWFLMDQGCHGTEYLDYIKSLRS